ncbi:heterokaryon incompatibility, partial [Lentithecium fluviatile CBS 122367]
DMHATKYRCLSYMWGDPDEGYEICVNDRTVRVRKNLYDFLRTVSQKFQDLPLWIDALCVNQNDMNERGHEVKRMSRIYHNAEEVLMWLGVDGDLKALFDCTKSRLQDVWKGRITGVQRESLLTSIDTFYSHPYWSRTWITQEILEANRVRVL